MLAGLLHSVGKTVGGLVKLFTADGAVSILIQPLKQFVTPFFRSDF